MFMSSKRAKIQVEVDGELMTLKGEVDTTITTTELHSEAETSILLCSDCPVQLAFRSALAKREFLKGVHPVTGRAIHIKPVMFKELLPNDDDIATGVLVFRTEEINS